MKSVLLATLAPGQRFRLWDDFVETDDNSPDTALTRVRGTVKHVTSGSVCVRLDAQGTRTATMTDRQGQLREVTLPVAAKTENWSLSTTVVPLDQPPVEPEPVENSETFSEKVLDTETEIV